MAKISRHFHSRERKFQDIFAPGDKSFMSLLLPVAKVPRHFFASLMAAKVLESESSIIPDSDSVRDRVKVRVTSVVLVTASIMFRDVTRHRCTRHRQTHQMHFIRTCNWWHQWIQWYLQGLRIQRSTDSVIKNRTGPPPVSSPSRKPTPIRTGVVLLRLTPTALASPTSFSHVWQLCVYSKQEQE